jgi:hypothetical protein
MRYAKVAILGIFTLILGYFVIGFLLSADIPKQIIAEVRTALSKRGGTENKAPYTKYENSDWNVSFYYPSHLSIAEGPSEDGNGYAIALFTLSSNDKAPGVVYGDREMMGVRLSKKRNFEDEVTRVGGERTDLKEEFKYQGYPAVKIKEHTNPVNKFKEESVVVDQGEMRAAFFVSYKEDILYKSYFNHMLDTFKFSTD